jgi:hypothetical protein
MKLQEQILRIQSMMGLVTENIDDILDKINRGEQLSKEDKDKMDAYKNHLNSGGGENDFNYEPEVAKQETGEIDYESLLNKLIYDYLENLFKDSFYVRGTKQREIPAEFLKLSNTVRRMKGDDNDENDENTTQINKYTMVGRKDERYNYCQLSTTYNLLNSDRNISFLTAGHITPISKFIKNYVDNTTDQNIKDSYENEGILYRWYNLNDYKDDEKRLINVVLKWVDDKFGEKYDESEFSTKGINTSQNMYFQEFIKENGIDGYVRDL